MLALQWAAAGTALDNGRAMLVLGELYLYRRAGLPEDNEYALKLRVQAAEYGCANSIGLYRLAQMFAEGKGTSVDMDKAAYWMRKAVARNFPLLEANLARVWLLNNCMDMDGL